MYLNRLVFVMVGTAKAKVSQPAQSDQGLHCPRTESLDTNDNLNGEQRPG